MNIKEYILSGIVESYVMGLASEQESKEFEQLCSQYPELVEARTSFELKLEKQAMENAIAPPIGSKEKIWTAIQSRSVTKPTKIINMEPTTRKSSGTSWVAAASIILLLGAAYFAYDFYSKNKKLQTSNKELQSQVDKLSEEQKWMGEVQKMMSDPNVAVVNLVGTTPAKASANVYWDTAGTSPNVYLVVKNMPKLPSDKQYQLWSIINGQDGKLQPTSMGLFDVGDDGKVILKMNNTQKADAFAITIENRGNTGGPTLEQLQSMGKPKL